MNTLREEIEKLLNMGDSGGMELLGQSLIVFSKVNRESTEITDLNGEWWEKLSASHKRVMLMGLALPEMVNIAQLIQNYQRAGLNA